MSDALRPTTFGTYVGQPRLVARLRVLVADAKSRGVPLPHVLLSGPPGLGKTTLANVIANEMGSDCHLAMAPGIEKPVDLYGLLGKLRAGDVLFVDEVHRLPAHVAECLYPAMEDGFLEVVVGSGANTYRIKHELPPFTLVGATTHPGLLEAPLRERFGASLAVRFYSPDELAVVLKANAAKLGLRAEPCALRLLAERSRGTPRVANHLLRDARAYANVHGGGELTPETALAALDLAGIDHLGLTEQDRQFLSVLQDVYGGDPTGSKALAATLGLTENHVADVIEPFLLQAGLVARTPRGRVLTERGKAHLAAVEPSGESLYAGAELPRHDAVGVMQ